jgi:acetylornithine/succinyldiaminopimelate/putrescine aminotransferase
MSHDAKALYEQARKDFARHVNDMKLRTLRHAGLDLIFEKAEGAFLYEMGTGRRFIDCICSAGTYNVGHRNPDVIQALKDALDHYDIGIFLFASKPKADCARRLSEVTPGDLTHVTYGSGGGEANDFAIKLSRGYTMKPGIISMEKGYHGHTGFSLSAIGRDAYRKPFEPLMPGFKLVPFNNLKAVKDAMTEDTAAVILEPVQGEGGIYIATDDYLKGLRELCNEREVLLIFDEIQTGWGRTGKMFACEHSGVVPDILTVAKSISGGIYPISATIYKEELNDFLVTNPFIHLSTFGGSDLGCIVAMATIDYLIKHKIPEHAARMGERFQAGFDVLLKKYPQVFKEVRRMGLMMGLQFSNSSIGPRMSYQLAQRGVIAIYTGNDPSVMRLMPVLTIQSEEVDLVLKALDGSMQEIVAQGGIEEDTYGR